ncbi:Atu4866 domain-containing protein [Pseudoduganella lutea]|uniref:Uncharacterized protein n=1 Tax=Pseudoduganella lutea TaxID=321985 RepID=A0A4P6L3H8_9BURK|nr:Atu4866 domain-containing protein [Pseudoduganella lutea]QBE65398.1 hypothetical protein EWM63_22390 [Pseudoduganella lutea]
MDDTAFDTKGAAGHGNREQSPQGPGHPYAGVWVTADGYIRHELLANGRYDEARGRRRSAYRGRYWIVDDHIEYLDDTGFTADGDFRGGVLYHAGMVLYRE